MMVEIDLTDVTEPLAEILEGAFSEFTELGEEGTEELQNVTRKIVQFWEKSKAGDEGAERALKHAHAVAQLIAAEYVIEGKQVARQKTQQIVEMAARIGFEFVKRLL